MLKTAFNNKRNNTSEQDLFQQAVTNQANYINFTKTDIVITTPCQFEMLNQYGRIKHFNPRFIVIDEADCLLDSSANFARFMMPFLAERKLNQNGNETKVI